MKNQKTAKSIAIQYGLILGILLSLFTAYSFAIDNSLYFNYWALLLLLLSVLILGLLSILNARKLVGFITFKNALKNYLTTITIGLFISTLTSIIIFNIVDTEFHKTVQKVQLDGLEAQKEKTLERMFDNNTPEKTIESTEKRFDDSIENIETSNPYTIANQLKNFAKSVGIYMLLGMLLSLIFKRKNSNYTA